MKCTDKKMFWLISSPYDVTLCFSKLRMICLLINHPKLFYYATVNNAITHPFSKPVVILLRDDCSQKPAEK